MTVRELLIDAGIITPSDGADARSLEVGLTPFRSTGAVLRIDTIGRVAAAEHIAHPEQERGAWKRGGR